MPISATHNDNVQVSITQAPIPGADAKFTTVLYMRDGIAFDGTERVRTYASTDAAQEDLDASEIDATTYAAVAAALSQPGVTQVKVGRVDTAAPETYVDALDAILAEDSDFWAIVLDVRTAAIQIAVAADLVSKADLSDGFRGILVMQSSDADWKTSGLPAAYSAITTERTSVIYNDTDTELDDLRWACNRMAFDPDERSAPWDGPIVGGSNVATDLTDAQKTALDGNYANHSLPFGDEPRWVDGGWMLDGAWVYEALTTDWFHVRLGNDIANRKAYLSTLGRKWTLDAEGKAMLRQIIQKRFDLGVDAKHFKDGQTSVTVQAISAADLALGRLRAAGEATYLGSGRIFRTDLVFGREDINPTA